MGFIVSFTSHRARLHFVRVALSELASQTAHPDFVAVNLPLDCSSTFDEAKLPSLPFHVEINWVPDSGPATKLIPTLHRHPSDVVITIDDDVSYRPTLLEELYQAHLAFPGHRVAALAREAPPSRRLLRIPYILWPRIEEPATVVRSSAVPLGAEGVLYPPGSLSSEVGDTTLMFTLAPTCDDIWFWVHGERASPGVVVLPFAGISERRAGSADSGLWRLNRNGANNRALTAVVNTFGWYPERTTAGPSYGLSVTSHVFAESRRTLRRIAHSS